MQLQYSWNKIKFWLELGLHGAKFINEANHEGAMDVDHFICYVAHYYFVGLTITVKF
mgnify:CR=1 FL=1